jgi:hypothetical protein
VKQGMDLRFKVLKVVLRDLNPILLCLFFLYPSDCRLQVANQWINYNQQYYKFPIYRDGIYRISFQDLQSAGIPVTNLDPRSYQIFARGKEIPLHIPGEADGQLSQGDYIEFFAKKNDAWIDSLVYDTASNVVNPYVSIANDTIYHFLTWNNSIINLRQISEIDSVNFNLYQAETYCFRESRVVYGQKYYGGATTPIGTTDPELSESEGFFGGEFRLNVPRTEQLSTKNVYAAGPSAQFTTHVSGASDAHGYNNDQFLKIYLNNIGGNLLFGTTYDGYKTHRINLSIPNNQLGNISTSFAYESVLTGPPHLQYQTISFAKLKYAHTFDFEGLAYFDFSQPINIFQAKSIIDFTNLGGAGNVFALDITNRRRLPIVNTGSGWKFISPNFGNEKRLLVFRESEVLGVSGLSKVNNSGFFTPYAQTLSGAKFIIITHPSLQVTAQQYANYRTSKGLNAATVNIDELYQQFSFGIPKHPASIRNFASWIKGQGQIPCEYIFLFGKAYSAEIMRYDTAWYRLCLVPTMGYPASDNLLTARITGTTGYEPGIPVGRIAAKTIADAEAYLNKVIEYESQSQDIWMKEILHFAGGFDVSSQAQLKYYLQQYEKTLEDTLFGGHATTFTKTSTAPIQITATDSIRQIIENGVSIMNFFGHAAGSGFDQNIDDPSTYNWNGKYPLLVANSCFVGNIHLPAGLFISASENYVLSPNAGTIGFLAQVGSGLPSVLFTYTDAFFKKLGQSHYGMGIGKAMQEAIKTVQVNSYDFLKQTCLEMTLHGDPAVRVHSHPTPDYYIASPDIFFTPRVVSTQTDSFNINVIVSNQGRAIRDNLILEVKRYLPNGSLSGIYSKVFSATYFRDTISLRLPVDLINGPGINRLEIFVDASNKVAESNEINNRIEYNLFIRSDDINPIYPYEFAIYPNRDVTLKASTGDPLAPVRNYRFEIDTTDLFINPLSSGMVSQSGGVIKWKVPFQLNDSVVYFWRVCRDSLINGNYRWRESSFQFIEKRRGWSQAHFFQFGKNDYRFMRHNRQNRRFEFVANSRMLSCKTFSAPPGLRPSDADLYATQYMLDAEIVEYAGCTYAPAIHVAVIDSLTLEPWGKYWVDNSQNPPVIYNPSRQFGNANNGSACRDQMERYFIFRTGVASQMTGLKNMLQTGIPDGHYVLAWTWIRGGFQNIADTSVITAFEALGADSMRFLPDHKAWIFFAQKGNPSTAAEVISPGSGYNEINFNRALSSTWNKGLMTSTEIGPSLRWDTLYWHQRSVENLSTDSISLKIIGIKANGVSDTLASGIYPGSEYIFPLSGLANAAIYPKLLLHAITSDDQNLSPAQMRKWQITYQEVPECAVNPSALFSYNGGENKDEGEFVNLRVAIENVSEQDMDSLLVKFWAEDRSRQIYPLNYTRYDSLLAGDTMHAELVFDTKNFYGQNFLWMEANPKRMGANDYDQVEKYHFNNFLQVALKVNEDITNPLLDVTFDGVRILNGDIVSPEPEIQIQLKDENRFRLLNDTGNFAIYILYPNEIEPRRLWFSVSGAYRMEFIPGSSAENRAQVKLFPVLKTDGKYTLIAEAKDAAGNKSGDNLYKVEFEVINRSTITNVMNYPNPFTSKTRFVFTLTGSKIPDDFFIRIMTVSGKIVKEIGQDELGIIRIGRNITDYAWDGTDNFGDRLANGVYLYKVFVKLNGQEMERRESAADDYFRKGWGKMVLMR